MYTYSKLSLISSIAMLMTFIAERFGILDKRYLVIVLIIGIMIQMACFMMVITGALTGYKKIHGVKMTRVMFNNKLVKASDYIIPGHISTTNPRKSAIFEILAEIKDDGELPLIEISKVGVVMATKDVKNRIVNVDLSKSDNNLMFSASIVLKPDEKINFGFKKDTVVKSFFLGEHYVP